MLQLKAVEHATILRRHHFKRCIVLRHVLWRWLLRSGWRPLFQFNLKTQMVTLFCTVNIGLEMKHLRLPITKQTVGSGAYQTPATSGSIDLHFKIIASRW